MKVFVVVILRKILIEFNGHNTLARRIQFILNRGRIGDKIDALPSGRL
jgi:hypothetical protein